MQSLSPLNMSINAHTLLSEEHMCMSVIAAALTKLTTNKFDSLPKCTEELVNFTMVLVRGSEPNRTVTAAILLKLWALVSLMTLSANLNKVESFYSRIAALVICVLESATEKPWTFNVRTRMWANYLQAFTQNPASHSIQRKVFVGQSRSRDRSGIVGTKTLKKR